MIIRSENDVSVITLLINLNLCIKLEKIKITTYLHL